MAARSLGTFVLLLGLQHAAPASASGSSGSLTVTAAVPRMCSVAVTGPNYTLDLGTGATDLKVVEVNESCNARTGYKLVMRTANGSNSGLFRSTATGPGGVLPYSVKYGDAPVSFAAGEAVLRRTTSRVPPSVAPVLISFDTKSSLGEGVYEDVLTFTMVMN